MGTKGGKRQGAGRKPGIKNKVNEAIKRKMLEGGEILPVEFMLQIMRAPEPRRRANEGAKAFMARYRSWSTDRLEAAKAAAPYIQPKLQSIEHKGDPDKPLKTSLTVEFVGGA